MKIFDIIKYEGPNDVFVWKFPGQDFNTLSQLIVAESQEALFFKDGKALDLFGPGKYTLHTQNIPLLRRLVNLPFNGESPFHCEVFFFNKVVSMDVKWGTSSPILIEDPKYMLPLQVRANGQFAVKVVDSRKLLVQLVGMIDQFDQQTLRRYFKGVLLAHIKDYISKQFVQKQISVFEIQSHMLDISNGIRDDLRDEFLHFGIELVNFYAHDISPVEDEDFQKLKEMRRKKREMEVYGYDYQQERTFDILNKAAGNQGTASNIMGAGMGLGMGINLGGVFGNTMSGAMSNVQPKMQSENVKQEKMTACPACGAKMPEGAKFCLECGAKMEPQEKTIICPTCGAKVPEGAKFCLECGNRIELVCKNCGAKLVPGAKFCFECGNKI